MATGIDVLTGSGAMNNTTGDVWLSFTVPTGELWYAGRHHFYCTNGTGSNDWDPTVEIFDTNGNMRHQNRYSWYSVGAGTNETGITGDYLYPGEKIHLVDRQDNGGTGELQCQLALRRIL